MRLSAGTRLGPYEILSALGAGGMGEVYRARDTKLNRHVAIKVLPDVFAGDPERMARFQREAQVLAALNHPNIAHIHGFEDSNQVHALVMELVDGPTLAERIAEGPIPQAEAIVIAQRIAEALEAAHARGIIHRDLKPANVKVREDGTVKVLDFGLAKLMAPDTTSADERAGAVSQSPTLTTPAGTRAGMILGTAAYMSPEQAKGRVADKRSDVWAFGVVLYEMLTGRRPFRGEDLSDTLAAVLKSDPDLNVLPADVPPHIRMLIQRCLAKEWRQRMSDMSVALFVLTDAASFASAPAVIDEPARVPKRSPLWRRLLMPAAAAILAGAAAGGAMWLATRPSAAQVTRFAFSPPAAGVLTADAQSRDFTITPDGRHIVYKGTTGPSASQLFVRTLDKLEPTVLTGPGTPRGPFPSPDGQWIGFVEPGPVTLKKVAITGGPVLTLAVLDGSSRGATWGGNDSIIVATAAPATGLLRVPASGGEPTVLTKPNREQGEGDHIWPQFLPGSNAVLFTITPLADGLDASQVAVLDLRTGTYRVVLRGGSQARYVKSGHLVYFAAGALRAVPFDLEGLEPSGTAILLVAQIMTLPTGTAEFDIADDGTLVYMPGGAGMAPARALVWVDRQGGEEAITAIPQRAYVAPRLSPDGSRIALEIRDQNTDIWIWDIVRQTLERLTSDPGIDQAPAWTPDGKRLVFGSETGGAAGGIFWQAADGTSPAERLTTSPAANFQRPSTVSADGTRILFWSADAGFGSDLMMLAVQDRTVQPVLRTRFQERNGELSPDGRWLAYESNDSGQFQISVRPIPDVNSGKWQVSTAGGTQPLWGRNGQELFYLALDGSMMSVRVGRGSSWSSGTPIRLFEQAYYIGISSSAERTYDVSADGKRFLMIKPSGAADPTSAPASLVVVQNWLEELKRLVPTK